MKNMNRGGGFNGRLMAALAVSAALFVPLAVFGAPAFATPQHATSSQYQYKVAVCHHTHSASHPWVQINVASAGWLHGHSKHRGDFLVTSASPCPPTTAPGSTVAPSGHGHGNDGGHGKDTHGSSSPAQGSSDTHGNGNGANGNDHGNGNGNSGNGNGHHH